MSSMLVALNRELTALVSRIRRSTVTVSGYSLDLTQQSTGSGWLYDDAGHIVTNHHVIGAVQRKLEVSFAGLPPQDAVVVGSDADTDLAIIRPTSLQPHTHMPLLLRHQAAVVGELCVAFGSPLSYHESVNLGIISGLSRQLQREAGKSEESIQVDVAINPGNSGGPLVDIFGEVLGVTVAKHAGAENINFAIPAEIVADIVPELIQYGTIVRGTLGIKIGATWANDGSQRHVIRVQGLRDPQTMFQLGDEIVMINGTRITRRYDVRKLLKRSSVGTVFAVEIIRAGKNMCLEVPIRERPTP